MTEDRERQAGQLKDIGQTQIVNDLEGVPTIFIDGFQGIITVNGVVKINAYQIVQEFNPDATASEEKRLIVARLAMASSTLAAFMDWLGQHAQYEKVAEPKSQQAADDDGRGG